MVFLNYDDDLDKALDQLIENAEMLKHIADDATLQEEKRALEDIQESLLHHLIHRQEEVTKIRKLSFQNKIQVVSEHHLSSEKLKQYDIDSVFRKRKIMRKSRMKQGLSSQE